MPTFTERRGDILRSTAQVLVNPVNCAGAMGAGLAKQFRNRYPQLDAQYRADCRKGLVKTGQVRLYRVSETHTVANLPTKDHWRDPSRLEYIQEGLIALNDALKNHGFTSVAIPGIGAGLGGLDWADVKPLILKLITHDPLRVEIHPPR